MALITRANYKTYRGETTTTYDSVFDILITSAEAEVRRYCDRNSSTGFQSATYTENYEVQGDAELQLRETPITSITTVKIRDDTGTLGTALTSTTYNVELDTGILHLTGVCEGRYATAGVDGWPVQSVGYGDSWGASPNLGYGRNRVQVVYVGGYTTIPGDLVQALYEYIDWKFARRGRDTTLQSESLGAYSYTRSTPSDAASDAAMLESLFGRFRRGTV